MNDISPPPLYHYKLLEHQWEEILKSTANTHKDSPITCNDIAEIENFELRNIEEVWKEYRDNYLAYRYLK